MWNLSAGSVRYLMAYPFLAAASTPLAPQQQTAYNMGFRAGILLGAFIAGAIVGLLPLIVALRRGRRTFAFASWASCILANFLLGIFLSIPVAVVLTVVVLCLARGDVQAPVGPQAVEAGPGAHEGASVHVLQVGQPECAGSSEPNR